MGALDRAGYRSAELYLDAAKQKHIETGKFWTLQLQQAARQARRACQRGRGPAKQAHPLPLKEVSKLPNTAEETACGGPSFPIRSTLLASWWLLREIEAQSAEIDRITIDQNEKLVHWRLPSSKADWRALGAVRTHSCACSEMKTADLCPFHLMVAQVTWAKQNDTKFLFFSTDKMQTTKAGWADTFETIARQLQIPTETAQGARKFTGHSARASGAVHLANTQIELWRIQLFGRWGSNVFQQYVRDAPLSQLQGLAQEATLKSSLAAARAELSALLAQARSAPTLQASSGLKSQPVTCMADCESAAQLTPQSASQTACKFVINRATHGKVHKVSNNDKYTPHHMWHTHCFWHFARCSADYSLTDHFPEGGSECAKCFKHPHRVKTDDESSSSSSSKP